MKWTTLLISAAAFAATSCATGELEGTEDPADPFAGGQGPGDEADEVRALADEYLFAEVNDQRSMEIRAAIRNLDESDAERFGAAIKELSGFNEEEAALYDALTSEARTLGLSTMDLRPADYERVVGRMYGIDATGAESMHPGDAGPFEHEGDSGDQLNLAICIYPWVACSTSTFTGTLYGASCASGCTRGSYSDRRSNGACELLACDYRMRFSDSTVSTIDGRTSAADCVILYYDSDDGSGAGLIYYTSGSYSYALAGFGGRVSCGLSATNIHLNFQVR